MIHVRKTIGRNHLLSEVGTNPKNGTCFRFMARLRDIVSKKKINQNFLTLFRFNISKFQSRTTVTSIRPFALFTRKIENREFSSVFLLFKLRIPFREIFTLCANSHMNSKRQFCAKIEIQIQI